MARAFGSSLDRLRAIAARHVGVLQQAETLVHAPLANDATVDPGELLAFLKFRAVAALWAACSGDPDVFGAALSDARELSRRGHL